MQHPGVTVTVHGLEGDLNLITNVKMLKKHCLLSWKCMFGGWVGAFFMEIRIRILI